jgi:Peptidase family M28
MSKMLVCTLLVMMVKSAQAQTPAQSPVPSATVVQQNLGLPGPPIFKLEDSYLKWRLLPSEQEYAAIDGKHLEQYVNDFMDFAYHYRDQGHQFWGRIMGTSGDVENEQWLLNKFKKIGLADVHEVPVNLPPQWMPQSWELEATVNGTTLPLGTAWPAQNSPGTPESGLNLEAVYVGLGSEADYHGLDVHGKAVVIFSIPLPGSIQNSAGLEGATRRAEGKGAAAIIVVVMLPGNVRTLVGGARVPTFSIGMNDGYGLRDLIGLCPPAQKPYIRLRLDVQVVPNLKTAIAFGSLPGTTDETIYILAHRDSWFQGAADNASGVATMLGLAEYFAKIPKEKRLRTIVFVGTPGHHFAPQTPWGPDWLAAHNAFAKTALLINCEHTTVVGTHVFGETIRKTNIQDASNWYVGGSPRFADITVKALQEFGVPVFAEPNLRGAGEINTTYKLAPSFEVINEAPTYFHSDQDDSVPPTGLENITRAYAKVINEVNKVDLRDLQRTPDAN